VPFLPPEGKEKFLVVGDAVLVNHPFQRAAVAEAILIGFGGDRAQRKGILVEERRLVIAQLQRRHPPI
jgi:hypothetical protein